MKMSINEDNIAGTVVNGSKNIRASPIARLVFLKEKKNVLESVKSLWNLDFNNKNKRKDKIILIINTNIKIGSIEVIVILFLIEEKEAVNNMNKQRYMKKSACFLNMSTLFKYIAKMNGVNIRIIKLNIKSKILNLTLNIKSLLKSRNKNTRI